jgi:aldehyde:ferredoxin oxidoreductase
LYGYHGRALHVDATDGSVTEIPLSEADLRSVIGGVGLGTLLLLRLAPPGIDALAPEAPLVIAGSPLVGTPLTTSAKFAVVAKSPLTNRIGDALSSSHFAIELKRAGVDALVISGRAPALSTLVLRDGEVSLDDADHLAGLSARDAEERLREDAGDPGLRALACGPAAERGVLFANLSNGGRHAGRGGLGSVLAAKGLKAVAVRGTGRVEVAEPEAVVELARDLSRRSFGPATGKYREVGTVANVLVLNRLGALPAHNFRDNTFEEAPAVSGEELSRLSHVRRESCAACTIGCEHIFRDADGREGRLEYESLFALGPLCGVSDRDVVQKAAMLCDDLGIDTISAGGTVAFLMECRERGLLDDASADGVDLRFGNGEALLEALRRGAARRGPLGELVALGSRRAAERLGGNAADLAPHVKGLEMPGYHPSTMRTMAVGLATTARGADHNRSSAYEADLSEETDRRVPDAEKGRLAASHEDRAAILDVLILCKFLRGVFDDLPADGAGLLRPVTGWNVDGEELLRAGERVVNLRKLYNLREGWTREEDTLPARLLEDGPGALGRDALDAMIHSYYEGRGWDGHGVPTPATVERLGLEEFAAAPAEEPQESRP